MITPLDQHRAAEVMKIVNSFSMLEQLEEDKENNMLDLLAAKLSEFRKIDTQAPLSLNDYRDMVEMDHIQNELGLNDLRPDQQ